jgi:hypothetical protein
MANPGLPSERDSTYEHFQNQKVQQKRIKYKQQHIELLFSFKKK